MRHVFKLLPRVKAVVVLGYMSSWESRPLLSELKVLGSNPRQGVDRYNINISPAMCLTGSSAQPEINGVAGIYDMYNNFIELVHFCEKLIS